MNLVRPGRLALWSGLVGFALAAALVVSLAASGTRAVSSDLANPSRHHSKIVFTRAPRHRISIAVMRPDGSHIHILIHNGDEPAFSPDAMRIVFSRERHSNRDIYVMRADGSDVRRLTRKRAADKTPVFSPDGRKIAFASRRDGNSEIYVMRADGTHQRRLTHNPFFQAGPEYSLGGRRIAFTNAVTGSSTSSR